MLHSLIRRGGDPGSSGSFPSHGRHPRRRRCENHVRWEECQCGALVLEMMPYGGDQPFGGGGAAAADRASFRQSSRPGAGRLTDIRMECSADVCPPRPRKSVAETGTTEKCRGDRRQQNIPCESRLPGPGPEAVTVFSHRL